MPRKLRPGKMRRRVGFPWAALSLRDMLRLSGETAPELPITEDYLGQKDLLVTRADFAQAYRDNRLVLLTPRTRRNELGGHFPGRRPWGFWEVERGMDPPVEQLLELDRLGLVGRKERAELVEWLGQRMGSFSERETKLIRGWATMQQGIHQGAIACAAAPLYRERG
jgi:hypothetical protein